MKLNNVKNTLDSVFSKINNVTIMFMEKTGRGVGLSNLNSVFTNKHQHCNYSKSNIKK